MTGSFGALLPITALAWLAMGALLLAMLVASGRGLLLAILPALVCLALALLLGVSSIFLQGEQGALLVHALAFGSSLVQGLLLLWAAVLCAIGRLP